jgi:hypothetical protein
LPHVSPWLVPLGVGVLLALVYLVASRLWEPMGQAEAATRPSRLSRRRRHLGHPGVGAADDVGVEDLHRVEVEAPQEGHGCTSRAIGSGGATKPRSASSRCAGCLSAAAATAIWPATTSAWDKQFAHTRPAG